MDSVIALRSGHRTTHPLGKSIPRLLAAALALGASVAPAMAATTPGTAPGQFSVSPTGAATYQISIPVPPGVNGLKPNVALLYNSQAGNGLLGQGWSLSGLSVISHCPKTMEQDGVATIPYGLSSDRLCLDGQRLIMTSNGTTYGAQGSTYRTEIDSFRQVTISQVVNGNPSVFTVVDRGGLTSTYGGAGFMVAGANGGSAAAPLLWLVSTITDRYNNFINFSYNISNYDALTLKTSWDDVSQITYGNAQGAVVGQVAFTYSPAFRADAYDLFFAFTKVTVNPVKLTNITVKDGSGRVQDSFILGYQDANLQLPGVTPTELKSVQECGSDGTCYPATTFNYGGASTGFASATDPLQSGILDANGQIAGYVVADFDGDGIPDYVFSVNGTVYVLFGNNNSTSYQVPNIATDSAANPGISLTGAIALDLNGDGKQELMVPYYPAPGTSNNNPVWWVLQWNKKTGANANLTAGQVPTTDGNALPTACVPVQGSCVPVAISLDLNHSGQSSVVYAGPDGMFYYYANAGGYPAKLNPTAKPTNVAFMNDVNGVPPKLTPISWQGASAIYVSGQNVAYAGVFGWNVNASPSPGFTSFMSGDHANANQVVPFDANGDGYPDAVAIDVNNWCYVPNTGTGFNTANASTFGPCVTAPSGVDYNNIQVIDWYGDGRQEVMVPISGTWYLFVPTTTSASFVSTGISIPVYDSGGPLRLLDVNGDGQPDLVYSYNGRTQFVYGTHVPYLINQITDGLGHNTQVGYVPMGAEVHGAYVNNPGFTPPPVNPPETRLYAGAMNIVKYFTVDSGTFDSSGNPQQIYTYYLYGGAAINQWGRGFLGFSQVEAINFNAGLYTTDTYRQDFPFTGMVATSTKTWDPNATLQSVYVTSGGSGGIKVSCGGNPTEPSCDIVGAPKPPHTAFLSGGTTISSTTNLYVDAYNPAHPTSPTGRLYTGVYSPYQSSAITQLNDIRSNQPYEITSTSSTYQVVGSSSAIGGDVMPTDITVTTSDPNNPSDSETVDTQTPVTAYSKWESTCPGHPGTVTVIHSSPAVPNGLTQTETFTYDGNCFLAEDDKTIIDPAGSARYPMILTKMFVADNYGNPLQAKVSGSYVSGDSKSQDNNGNNQRVTIMTYDPTERFPRTITNPLQQTETVTYDDWGNKRNDTDANGNSVTYTYDGFERKKTQSGPLPNVKTTWSYGACGSNCAAHVAYQVTQTGSDGSSSTTEIDELGRTVRNWHVGFAGETINQDTQYDLLGRAVLAGAPTKTAHICWDQKVYDVLNRVTSEYQPLNSNQCDTSGGSNPTGERAITTSYNGLTTTRTVTVPPTGGASPTSEMTITTLNVLGKPASVTDQGGQTGGNVTTTYSYDVWGNLTSVTPPPAQPGGASPQVLMTYDSIGDKLSMQDPDMGSWGYTYDALGELLTQTDANGNTVTNQYDWLGRLFDRQEAEGETRWVYDAAYGAGVGKLAYTVGPLDSNGALKTNGAWEGYAYDGFGETTDKITVVGGQEYWVTNTYDDQGRVSQVVYPNMTAVNVSSTPAAPAALTVAVDQNNGAAYDLTWQINSTQNGQIFHLYRTLSTATQPADADEIYSGPVPNWQDTTITTDNTYVWWLKACNDTVCSGLISSAAVNVILPPTAPSAPHYLGDSHQRNITLTWLASTSRGGTTGPITYNVSAIFTPWGATTPTSTTVVAPGVADTGTQYASTTVTLSQDGTYAFSVRACQGPEPCSAADGGFMTYTTVLQPSLPGVPNPPATVTPNTVPASIPFNWAASSFTGGPVIYEVQAKNSIGNNQFADIGPQPGSATSVTDIQNTDGVFLYQVQACDTNETPYVCSGYVQAGASTAVTLPPVNVTAPIVPPSDWNSYRWNFAYSPTATLTTSSTGTISYYIVQYLSGVSGYTLVPGPDVPSGGQNWRTTTAVSQGGYYQNGTYSYAIHACTSDPAVGSAMACSPWVNSGNYTTVIAPGVPTNINVPAQSNWDGTYTVTYSPPAANTGGIATNYSLQVYDTSCEQGGTNCHTVIDGRCSSTTTSCTFPGNSNTGDFSLQIEALDSGIASAWVQAGGINVGKTTVTGLSTNPAGVSYTGSFTLNWTALSGAGSYQIYQSANGGAYSLKGTSGTNSYPISGLAAGSYAYYVAPCSSTLGCGVGSAAVNETVQLVPGTPTNIRVSPNPSAGSYELAWDAAPGVVSYYIVNGVTSTHYTSVFVDYTKNRGGNFTYYVQACNSHGCGAQSGSVTETVNLTGCPPPPNQCQLIFEDKYDRFTFNVPRPSGAIADLLHQETSSRLLSHTSADFAFRRSGDLVATEEQGPIGASIHTQRPRMPFKLPATQVSAPWLELPMLRALAVNVAVPRPGNLKHLALRRPTASHGIQGRRLARLTHPRAQAPRLLAATALSPRQAYFLTHAGRTTAPKPGHMRRARHEAPAVATARYAPPIDPILSLYPPLRGDIRVLAHFVARGGAVPAQVRNANAGTDCRDTDNDVECTTPDSPNALMVGYVYNSHGYLQKVEKLNASATPIGELWQATDETAFGQVDQEVLDAQEGSTSGALSITDNYDTGTGMLNGTTASAVDTTGGASSLSAAYGWDGYNNLLSRSLSETVPAGQTGASPLSESFGYDTVNRMRQMTDSGMNVINPTYDNVGDIQSNGLYTGYAYGSPDSTICSAFPFGPAHAVSSLKANGVTRNFCYDANGNLKKETGDMARTLSWASYNKPTSITAGSTTETFVYGPSRERLQTTVTGSSGSVTTTYIDGLFEQVQDSAGNITYKHYILAGSARVGVETIATTSGTVNSDLLSFFVQDQVGSVIAEVTEGLYGTSQQLVIYGHDHWGKARPTSGTGANIALIPGVFQPDSAMMAGQHEGFAGHEDLEDIGIVDMEGRIYDPEVGRFLSPDPTVQYPDSSQGYNRFTYVGNNPLSLSDPTGYTSAANRRWEGAVAMIAVSWLCAGTCTAEGTAFLAGASEGYISSGGTWSGTAMGGMEAVAFAQVGGAFGQDPQGTQLFERSVSEGLLGGAFALAGGGRFSDGFLGSFVSSELSGEIGKIGGNRNDPDYYSPLNESARVAVSAIVGGSVSRLTGGSFGDAAVAAAFQRLFNDDHHGPRFDTASDSDKRPDLQKIVDDPNIKPSLEKAWEESHPDNSDYKLRVEHGGWVYRDNATGKLSIALVVDSNATWNHVNLGEAPPEIPGKTAIAWFHTHPNPHFDGDYTWHTGPSDSDTRLLSRYNLPGIIMSHVGMYYFGPGVPP